MSQPTEPAEIAAVRRWVERVVVGLNLCPFAAPVLRPGRVRFALSEAAEPVGILRAALAEATRLLDTPPEALATTLLVVPAGLEDFHDFLDLAAELESVLAEAGAEGVLQIATFHPDYLFEGEPEDGLSHWTNRAPHPVLHLLREDEMAQAIESHPDPEGIPAANIARLEALGPDALRALYRDLGVS